MVCNSIKREPEIFQSGQKFILLRTFKQRKLNSLNLKWIVRIANNSDTDQNDREDLIKSLLLRFASYIFSFVCKSICAILAGYRFIVLFLWLDLPSDAGLAN